MKNGRLINNTPSLFDNIEKSKDVSELEIYKINDMPRLEIKELTHKVRMAKQPPKARIEKMIEEGILDDFVDKNCRKKNGKINWAKFGREIGCHADSAKKYIKETNLNYLFDDSKNTYLE